MRSQQLSYERLMTIKRGVEALGDKATVRTLRRLRSIHDHEIHQAEALGWVIIFKRKPAIGRPANVVHFRRLPDANTTWPPDRKMIPNKIRPRHFLFALYSSCRCVKHGMRRWGFPAIVSAYIDVYHPRSRNGARVSASRLLRHPDVRAARAWFYAIAGKEIADEQIPDTAPAIWDRLAELGNWRARHR